MFAFIKSFRGPGGEQNRRMLCKMFGLWLFCMVVLMVDQFSIDYALIVTILIAVFGFILNLAMKLSRVEQKIDDLPCRKCPVK